uniref:Uncharacterized protein n=1 Tax=Cacopsylla melanoneura TaxID=428564 RepID=A0A8D8R6T2_9HEMI
MRRIRSERSLVGENTSWTGNHCSQVSTRVASGRSPNLLEEETRTYSQRGQSSDHYNSHVGYGTVSVRVGRAEKWRTGKFGTVQNTADQFGHISGPTSSHGVYQQSQDYCV